MRYMELTTEEDIQPSIDKIRDTYKKMSQIIVGGECETTMGGKKILTLFFRLEPVLKVEGDEELINLFSSRLKAETQGIS